MIMNTAEKVISAMSAYGIKQTAPNKYQSNSPFRAGSDSMAFSLTISASEHGAWHDFVSDESGSLYDLAQHLGIDTPRPVESTKRAYENLGDYALAHGITTDILRKAGWKEAKKAGRPALEFVTKGGARWRFIDGNKPTYMSVNGYKKCWYGMNETLLGRLAYGADLVICNGEISTVVGQAYGLATCAVTSGEGVIPAELLSELKATLARYPNNKVVVAMDCDEKGRKAGEALVKQLRGVGINANAIDLKLTAGGDLADFLALYGLDELDKALADFDRLPEIPIHEYVKQKRWQLMPARELANLPPVRWLIKGILPDNALTVIYGASGVGKSFITIDYSLTVAQEGSVIYMAGEGESGYHSRITAWTKHNSKTEGGLWMCLGAVALLDNGELEDFIYQIQEAVGKPKLIVVDTLARSMLGGDENSSRDMQQFIDRCDMLRQRFGCALVLVHHTSKAGIWERGSSALRGAADAMIRISDEDDVIVVESSKTKDSQPFETMYKKLMPVSIGMFNEDGDEIIPMVAVDTERMIDTDDLTRMQKLVLETAVEMFPHGFSVSEMDTILPQIGTRSLYKIVASLMKKGYVEQEAKRDPYIVTNEGMNILNMPNMPNMPIVPASMDNADMPTQKHEAQRAVWAGRAVETPLFDDLGEEGGNSYYENGM